MWDAAPRERHLPPPHDAAGDPRWLSELHRDIELPTSLSVAVERHARLDGGRAYVRSLLSSVPLDDVEALRARQAALRSFEAVGDDKDDAEDAAVLAEHEADALWFLGLHEDAALRSQLEAPYFDVWPLTRLNRSSPASLAAANAYRIVASPIVGVMTPIVYFVVPYLVLRMRGTKGSFKDYIVALIRTALTPSADSGEGAGIAARVRPWAKSASLLVSLAIYFHGVVSSFQMSSSLTSACRTLTAKLDGAEAFAMASRRRCERMSGTSNSKSKCPWSQDLWPFPSSGAVPPSRVAPSPRRGATWLALGTALADAASFDVDAMADDVRRAYAVDALSAVLRFRASVGGCFAEYVEAPSHPPTLELAGLFHPCVADAVDNNLSLGGSSRTADGSGPSASAVHAAHAVLTGPNAGGKSTLMKAALCAALLSQTATIACCRRSARLTPFALVSSQLNVADSAGTESLFQAEMGRAQRVIRSLDAMPPSGRALVVIDEIFSSTNPVEGAAAAAACARRMSANAGAIVVVSTHFAYLCGELRRSRFTSLCMPVVLDETEGGNGVARYPYRLQAGVCRQYVAIELLRRSGFDGELVDDAVAVKRRIVRRATAARRSPRGKEKANGSSTADPVELTART